MTSAGDAPTEPEDGSDELPPGQFVSDELRSDCSRFLEDIRNVVRRRSAAGLERDPSRE